MNTVNIGTFFCDHINYTTKGIGSIQSRNRSPDNFNTFHIMQAVSRSGHIIAAKNIVFHNAIDHQQRSLVLCPIHTSEIDQCRYIPVYMDHINTGNITQSIFQLLISSFSNLLCGNNGNGRRGLSCCLHITGSSNNFNVHQFFQ